MSTEIQGYGRGRNGVQFTGDEIERTDLYNQQGGSDKVYIAIMSHDPATNYYYATGFYGKRGGTMSVAGKYAGVSEVKARNEYEKLIKSKLAKFYQENQGDVSGPQHTSPARYTPPTSAYKTIDTDDYKPRILWPQNAQTFNDKCERLEGEDIIEYTIRKHRALIDDPNYVLEQKYDGIRITAHGTPDKTRTFGRNASVTDGTKPIEKTDNLPHIETIQWPKELWGTILDCELLPRNGIDDPSLTKETLEEAGMIDCATVSGNLNSKDGRDNTDLVLVVFDILQEGKVDLTKLEWKYRRMKLTALFNDVIPNLPGYDPETFPLILSRYTIKDKEQYLRDILAKGFEGGMFKHIDAKYMEGGRPTKNWYKVKKMLTADCIVTGWEGANEGKYVGMLGAIKFGQWITEAKAFELNVKVKDFIDPDVLGIPRLPHYLLLDCGKASGMTDAIRKDMTDHFDRDYLGKVIELEAMERLASGKFRHPRFVRIRDDRDTNSAIWED